MHKLANDPKVGKHLRGTTWQGKIDLTNKEQREYFYNYIGYKE